MNLIVHQFKTDWRHFRGALLGLWATFAAQLILVGSLVQGEAGSILGTLVLFSQILMGTFLVVRLVQADALVGASAQWLTRPLGRPHLFWAKTAFILLCIVLPRLLPQMILCHWHGYSADLWVASVSGVLLFTLSVVLFVAALAALTPDLGRFFLILGAILGVFFIWCAVLAFYHRRTTNHSASLTASATVMAFTIFAGCALVVWIWQVLTGRAQVGWAGLGIGLLLLPWMIYAWPKDFLAPRISLYPPLAITDLNGTNLLSGPSSSPMSVYYSSFKPIVTKSHQTDTGMEQQPLWSEFTVHGLPPHSLVFPGNTRITFNPKGQKMAHRIHSHSDGNGYFSGNSKTFPEGLPSNLRQQPAYMAVIHGFFPAETLWTGREIYGWDGFPAMNEIFEEYTNHPVIGDLHCDTELKQIQVERAVQVPLHPGSWNIGPGKRLVIRKLTPQQNGVQIEIEEVLAAPLLSRADYLTAFGNGISQCYFTYVLYHPDWQEADILDNNQYSSYMLNVINGESHRLIQFILPYPVLQERLEGVSLQNYLDKAALCVFMPVFQGVILESLDQTNFNLSSAGSFAPNRAGDLKDIEVIEQSLLPEHPSAAQITDYLDTILGHLPDNSGELQRRTIRSRLEAIGTPGIPGLLARLPLDDRAERDYVYPVLTKLSTREQLPELREALGRDLQLAEWFHDMKWDDDARDILVGKLGDHRREFSAIALRLAAEAKDPVTYADLAWHFARLGNEQSQVAAVLAKCPGFDLDGAVREAWDRVRLGLTQPGELAELAARQGLPDAFNQAVIYLEQTQQSSQWRQKRALQLAALTDFSGRPATAMDWLSANLGRFNYDAVSHRYLLAVQTNAQ